MGNLINKLKASGALKSYRDLRCGSLLDISGNGLSAPTVTGSPYWNKTDKGFGISSTSSSTVHAINLGNPASLQLNTLSIFTAFQTNSISGASYRSPVGKNGAYLLYINSSNVFGVWDNGGSAFRSSGYTLTLGKVHFVAVTVQAGVTSGTTMFVDGVQKAVGTVSISSQVNNWYMASSGYTGENLQGSTLLLGITNSILSPLECSQLYEEFLQDGNFTESSKRNFFFMPRSLNDAQSLAQSIALDTNYSTANIAGVRKIIDNGPNNYAGTITGIAMSGPDGFGLTLANRATDRTSFGDVTQLNSASAFTIDGWIETPPGTIQNGSYWLYKEKDANNALNAYTTGGTAASIGLNFLVYNGAGGTYGIVTSALRAGTKQHVCWTFNGAGATNADRMQVAVDGEDRTVSFTGTIPATTANLSGFGLQQILFNSTMHRLRVRSVQLTTAQRRAAYLEEARKVLLRETFEDVPVSLGAVGAGGYIGNWRVISGTWKCTETVDGKRWLECVTAGDIAMSDAPGNSTGTRVWSAQKVVGYGSIGVMFGAAVPGGSTATGQAGYYAFINAAPALALYLQRYSAGAFAATLMNTATGVVSLATTYTFACTRRPSDGRFSLYIKGGSYQNWTLVSVAGGSGSNPSAAETNTFVNQYVGVRGASGDKLCMYDPKAPSVGLVHYQGQLDPTAGDLP